MGFSVTMVQLLLLLLIAVPLLRLLVALLWPNVLKRTEGQRSESALVRQFGAIREDPLLQEVGTKLLAVRPVRASFGVLQGPLRNAVALPHGRVLVWEGLLEETHGDRDMLAGVLAHELGHLTHDHFLDRIQVAALARFVLGILGGGWLRRILQDTAATIIARGFSRAQEREADQEAVSIMRAAGFNPLGLARLLERLAQLPTANTAGLLGTHPDPADRARLIREALHIASPAPAPVPSPSSPEITPMPVSVPVPERTEALPDNVLPFPSTRRHRHGGG